MQSKRTPVIIAESDFLTGRLMLASLQGIGYAAAVGEDGDAVLKLIEKFSPKVVVLNMNIGRPNGLELLRALNGLKQPLRVLSITAAGQAEMKASARSLGATSDIELPFAPAEFAAHVKRLVEA